MLRWCITPRGLNNLKTWGPGVKERKLAGWGLRRGKAWKGSLDVTEKNTPPKWKPTRPSWRTRPRWNFLSSCCIWRRSRQPKWNGSRKTSKLCMLPGFHSPVMQKTSKNTINTTVFDSMDGGGWTHDLQVTSRQGGVKSDSIKEL